MPVPKSVEAKTGNRGDDRRVVVVTGAARGIGLSLCRKYYGSGCHVVGLDVDRDALNAARDSLSAIGSFLPIVADVSDRAAIDAAAAEIGAVCGRIDVLVNNAAIVMAQPFADLSQQAWERVIGVNLTGAFNCCQALLPLFADGGRMVGISSHSGNLGSRDRAAYAASKGGLNALTRVLAVELADRGITVNAIAPGPVETPHVREAHSAERREAWARALPIKRYAEEDEITALVMFLASPEAAYITGQIIAVDGGFSAAGLIETG